MGAVGAWLLGVATCWQFGWPGVAALMATVIVTTLLSKLPGRFRSGPRRLSQVAANGIPALLGCLISALGQPVVGAAFFLGGMACLGSDTAGSEVGVRYGGTPRRIGSRKPMKPGESGGITGVGLLARTTRSVVATSSFRRAAGLAGAG